MESISNKKLEVGMIVNTFDLHAGAYVNTTITKIGSQRKRNGIWCVEIFFHEIGQSAWLMTSGKTMAL
jgi:hypothetical protein